MVTQFDVTRHMDKRPSQKPINTRVVSVVVPAVRSFSSHPLKMDQKQARLA